MSKFLILLVDDNHTINFLHDKICSLTLKEAEIMKFCNGQEAADFLQENENMIASRKVLVLLDINMPIMNGWAFLEYISQNSLSDQLKVAMVSSSTTNEDKNSAFRFPMVVGYVEKPLTPSQLLELTAPIF